MRGGILRAAIPHVADIAGTCCGMTWTLDQTMIPRSFFNSTQPAEVHLGFVTALQNMHRVHTSYICILARVSSTGTCAVSLAATYLSKSSSYQRCGGVYMSDQMWLALSVPAIMIAL
jgi:hypothetical protein